tara:strand:- start:2895 stop:3092 length:198 start_codon:yes stop_codon:yes gene_type:complete
LQIFQGDKYIGKKNASKRKAKIFKKISEFYWRTHSGYMDYPDSSRLKKKIIMGYWRDSFYRCMNN